MYNYFPKKKKNKTLGRVSPRSLGKNYGMTNMQKSKKDHLGKWHTIYLFLSN